jgi:putative addiction module antidote
MTDRRKPTGVSDAAGIPFKGDAAKPKPAGLSLKVRRIGNSLGVVLPKEVLARLRVGEGDLLSVGEAPDGVTLRAFDDRVAQQVEAARDLMRRYRNALRELAK